ncbi:DUF6526 family protein [Paenibacillus montanisoli]|uniref:Uncharacterized protein n=1 Tax=Paenibacillus montanisoli TaxID=2081970 RepID=A0A328U2M5_9BACL|nr:DUF6526 family protein [Paenibacillus montanisoli]RAP74234.1 hypothetical protein DL346_24565 [Paenibacillus montanisoli]
MTKQNLANHRRYHPPFHYFLPLVLLAMLVANIFYVIKEGLSLSSILMLLTFVYLITINFFVIRNYPMKAQDRAIRAEENLRHYVLTGQTLDSRLTLQQVIALRFASDREFVELCKKAVSESLSPNDIKKAIKDWKGDYYRA